jgi:hypothetical protein
VIASAAIFSPRNTGAMNRSFCSSVPARTIGGNAIPWLPSPTVVPTECPAKIISSPATSACVMSPPAPPSSVGYEIPSSPARDASP